MGYKETDNCIKKAYPNERLFVLMTRDKTSPAVILEWIKLNLHRPEDQLREAFECVLEMRDRNGEFVKRIALDKEGKGKGKYQICDSCDGCGWYEGGPTLKTTCEKCQGTGVI